jgi:hypothetical protein
MPSGSFEEASRALAEAASTKLDQSSLPSPSKNVLRDLDHSLADLVTAVVRTNLRASQDLLGMSTHGEFAALQQRFICDGVVNLTAGGQRSALRTALCHAIAGTPATSHHVRKAVSRAWRCSVADRR